MQQISGLMAIEGVEADPDLTAAYGELADPARHGISLMRDIALKHRTEFLDSNERSLTIPKSIASVCKYLRAISGLSPAPDAKDWDDWYGEGEWPDPENHRGVQSSRAADIYLRSHVRISSIMRFSMI